MTDDLYDLVELLQLLFSIEENFDFDPTKQRLGLEMLLAEKSAAVMVAELEKKVIDMCTGQLLVSTAEGGFSLFIEDVVVDKPWQGHGIGTQLLIGLEKWACLIKVSRCQLLADRMNEAGLRFYEKQGWQSTQLLCLRKRVVTETQNEG